MVSVILCSVVSRVSLATGRRYFNEYLGCDCDRSRADEAKRFGKRNMDALPE